MRINKKLIWTFVVIRYAPCIRPPSTTWLMRIACRIYAGSVWNNIRKKPIAYIASRYTFSLRMMARNGSCVTSVTGGSIPNVRTIIRVITPTPSFTASNAKRLTSYQIKMVIPPLIEEALAVNSQASVLKSLKEERLNNAC